MSKTVLVTTTIRVPKFLEGVCKNALMNNREENLSLMVVGDKKTPNEAREFCSAISDRYRIPIHFYGPEEQEKKLAQHPRLLKLMPYNHGSRKLVGNFIAYLENCDNLIMLDDDNFVTNHDFFGHHEIVGRETEMDLFQTPSGWFNVCEALVEENNIPFYPRGYPWSQRKVVKEAATRKRGKLKVAVNNGLVLEDPDIDAISRLFWPIRVMGMKPAFEPVFGLYPGTWSSWNNQSTALGKNVIPAFFTPPGSGRNSDIWSAYTICRLAEHMQEVVAFGYPLVHQFRNPHNLWRDLEDESGNNKATDRFVALLRSVPLTKSTYLDSLGELLEGALAMLAVSGDILENEVALMKTFLMEYKVWQEICLSKTA